jgi:hypothetical protein
MNEARQQRTIEGQMNMGAEEAQGQAWSLKREEEHAPAGEQVLQRFVHGHRRRSSSRLSTMPMAEHRAL